MPRHRHVEDSPGVDLPITPMLDMAFQLLAFFIATYHPSALEGQLAIMLPAAGQDRAPTQAEVDPNAISDDDIEPPVELTILLKTQQDGGNNAQPDHYVVKGLQGASPALEKTADLEAYLKKEMARIKRDRQATTGELQAKEKAGRLTADEKKQLKMLLNFPIKLQPDSRVSYAFVVEVMDMCLKKEVGFTNVAFAPPTD